MKYYVSVNRKYQYVRVYRVVKRIHESSNAVSRRFAAFIDKLSKKNGAGQA